MKDEKQNKCHLSSKEVHISHINMAHCLIRLKNTESIFIIQFLQQIMKNIIVYQKSRIFYHIVFDSLRDCNFGSHGSNGIKFSFLKISGASSKTFENWWFVLFFCNHKFRHIFCCIYFNLQFSWVFRKLFVNDFKSSLKNLRYTFIFWWAFQFLINLWYVQSKKVNFNVQYWLCCTKKVKSHRQIGKK